MTKSSSTSNKTPDNIHRIEENHDQEFGVTLINTAICKSCQDDGINYMSSDL
eukprot:CAMPEP_0114977474 /NCGR_PEP_ID=MMETSP0216-20121206/3256_1 /TAXON_ID=223996 /ORGANISM="Protocruzia adherens, Strain Boccale" /LENGTH=51 /DNA_ID=CAMNT_0002338533 /DNA_START=341 /DNA_END=493 /DNA_ORIENTATION=+